MRGALPGAGPGIREAAARRCGAAMRCGEQEAARCERQSALLYDTQCRGVACCPSACGHHGSGTVSALLSKKSSLASSQRQLAPRHIPSPCLCIPDVAATRGKQEPVVLRSTSLCVAKVVKSLAAKQAPAFCTFKIAACDLVGEPREATMWSRSISPSFFSCSILDRFSHKITGCPSGFQRRCRICRPPPIHSGDRN